MFQWLKSLTSKFDRQEAAADRAAVALEEIALDFETMRDNLRIRFNAVAEVPAIEERPDVVIEPPRTGNGNGRRTVAKR